MGKKIVNMVDYEKDSIKRNELVLLSADRLIEWFNDPSILYDVFTEDQVENRYEAIPDALAQNIADIKAAKWPSSYRKAIEHVVTSLEQIHEIMLQRRQIEDNNHLPELLQETLRNECTAAIEVIWRRVTGVYQSNTGSV